ncbi:MAG: gfo/Idh/MocA family oxidoreductase, partial [Verrucomicrobiota bacterium]
LADDKFRIWDFQRTEPMDHDVKATMMQGTEAAGAGANDPNAIDFLGHQRNFEDVVEAIQAHRPPAVGGAEARRAVALICAIYESAQQGSRRIDLC